jgi:Protein of unknown function (DUF4254)
MQTTPIPSLRSAQRITELHDRCLAAPGWPKDDAADENLRALNPADEAALLGWVQTNHRCNALLWDEEDLARRTQVSDADIAANKRAIDRHNQARNDATERVDEILLAALGLVDEASARSDAPLSRVPPGARLNSETAGSMIDRLSIMALKLRAMRAQTERNDVDEAHLVMSRAKLARLLEQRSDLAMCLDALIADAQAGRAFFKVYRQFKMYNDPQMNPALVAERGASGRR